MSPILSGSLTKTTANQFGLTELVRAPIEIPTGLEYCLYARETNKPSGRAKRELEFAAGRYCAATALSDLGFEGKVGVAADRCPIWPNKTIGSISHSSSFVWAAVSCKSNYASLGIDTEPIVDPQTLKRLKDTVLAAGEFEFGLQNGLSEQEAFTVIYSAKESLYKCVYQLQPVFFAFHDVKVASIDSSTITLRLNDDCPNSLLAGTDVEIKYSIQEQNVFTAFWLLPNSNYDSRYNTIVEFPGLSSYLLSNHMPQPPKTNEVEG